MRTKHKLLSVILAVTLLFYTSCNHIAQEETPTGTAAVTVESQSEITTAAPDAATDTFTDGTEAITEPVLTEAEVSVTTESPVSDIEPPGHLLFGGTVPCGIPEQ